MKTQSNKPREKYIPPQVKTLKIQLEQSIAAGSAAINTGSESNSQTPSEREWESGWSNNRSYDL